MSTKKPAVNRAAARALIAGIPAPTSAPAPTANAKSMTLSFVPDSGTAETKRCFRFEEQPAVGAPPIIGTLYVQKFALDGVQPAHLTVTVQVS